MTVTVFQIKSEEAAPWCKRRHYARRIPPITYAFGLYVNEILEGVVTYGSLSTPQVRNGMFEDDAFGENIIELNRLCIDSEISNAATVLVGRSLKLLPKPKVVVSYADTNQGHIGYVYQAANFLYTGAVTAHDSEYLVHGKKVHPRTLAANGITAPKEWAKENGIEIVRPQPKHRYVYLHGSLAERRQMRRKLKYPLVGPYPKGPTRRYELGTPVPTQGVLFS